MSWLAGLKCGDERCGCIGNQPPSDWDPAGPYAGMGLDMSGAVMVRMEEPRSLDWYRQLIGWSPPPLSPLWINPGDSDI